MPDTHVHVAATVLPERSHGTSGTGNLLVEADNIDGLRWLLTSHRAAIKCIYIDPPYNTREQSQKLYKDSFQSHQAWLDFMAPRLRLARDLLRDDGVIFVHVDRHEFARLWLLMDDIFGEDNFIADFIWQRSTSNKVTGFPQNAHEYILCYGRNKANPQTAFRADPARKTTKTFPHVEAGTNRRYQLERLDKQSLGYRPTMDFPIEAPDGQVYCPVQPYPGAKQARWRWGQDRVQAQYDDLVFDPVKGTVYTKYYEHAGASYTTLLTEDRFGRTVTGTNEIKKLFGSKCFSHSKCTDLLTHLIHMCTDDGDIVLDFFAGSGTTGHAVIRLNHDTSCELHCPQGTRKSILVQLPSALGENGSYVEGTARTAGMTTITDITRERLRLAFEKHAPDNVVGFDYVRVVPQEDAGDDWQAMLPKVA